MRFMQSNGNRGTKFFLLFSKVIWIATVLVSLFALIWFVLGSTAGFQRGVDLITTVVFVYLGIPLVLFVALSGYHLYRKWSPKRTGDSIVLVVLMLPVLFMSYHLYQNTYTSGWLTERVTADTMQLTADGKYEYNIELINVFQKNSYARVYLKNTTTAEEQRIRLASPVKNIRTYSTGREFYWITLESGSQTDKYILKTNKEYPLPEEIYEVDVNRGEAKKLNGLIIESSFKSGSTLIRYPVVTNLKDQQLQTKINQFIEDEALTICETYCTEAAQAELGYTIMLNNDSVLSIRYDGWALAEGAAYPVKLLFTTNVDMGSGNYIQLADHVTMDKDFLKAYIEAAYIPSDGLDLEEAGILEELLNERSDAQLMEDLLSADQNNPSGASSYFTTNALGISIPVPHAVGDYLVMEISSDKLAKSMNKQLYSKIWG